MSDTEGRGTPERLFTCWHTNLYDGHSHAVTDEEFVSGAHKPRGEFYAVCGAVVCLAD